MIALSQRTATRTTTVPLEWRRWLRRAGTRVHATLALFFETYVAAQELQRTAHRRFPFAEW